jgi:hypothetical protein
MITMRNTKPNSQPQSRALVTVALALGSLMLGAGLGMVQRHWGGGDDDVTNKEGVAVSPMREGTPRNPIGDPTTNPPPVPSSSLALRSPPRFIPSSEPKLVENDPISPNYDALKLSRVTRKTAPVFQAELRDANWAAPLEDRLKQRLRREIMARVPDVGLKSVECRTQMCQVVFELPNEDVNTRDQTMLLLQRPELGVFANFTSEDPPVPGQLTGYLFMDRALGATEEYDKWYFDNRLRDIERARQQGRQIRFAEQK